MKKVRNFRQLTEIENKCLSDLYYFPEDKNVVVRHSFNSDEAKILAIAIYDWHFGAIAQAEDISINISAGIYKKLFNKNIKTLFDKMPDITYVNINLKL
jgi:hypothetical protein